jgi:hypothetical protein
MTTTAENAIPVPGEQLVIAHAAFYYGVGDYRGPSHLERVTVERVTPSGQIILTNGTRWRAWDRRGHTSSVREVGTLRREKPGEWDAWVEHRRRNDLLTTIGLANPHGMRALPTAALDQIVTILQTGKPLESL